MTPSEALEQAEERLGKARTLSPHSPAAHGLLLEAIALLLIGQAKTSTVPLGDLTVTTTVVPEPTAPEPAEAPAPTPAPEQSPAPAPARKPRATRKSPARTNAEETSK